MRRNDEIQSALIAYLKLQSVITAQLLPAGALEIREDQWQGTDFVYPNIRVRLLTNVPASGNCNYSTVTLEIQAYTEDASSFHADMISGIINGVLNKRSFVSNGVHFSLSTTNLVPAIRKDTRTWQSSVLMRGTISG